MDRRLFLCASFGASAQLTGCGGGGGGNSGGAGLVDQIPSGTSPPTNTSTPETPNPPGTPPATWPQDYVADTSGRILYVSPTGNNDAVGSLAAPFATLSHAVTVVAAGDTIVLANGTYAEAVSLTRSGAAGRYITIRAANPGLAKLVVGAGEDFSALALVGVGWIRVQGLDVQSGKDHGIQVENSHHIQLVGNTCHDCGGSGIGVAAGDYFLIEANTVFGNAGTNPHQTSGISIYQARAFDTAAGFHIILRRNFVHSNKELVAIAAPHSDGNGIILDDFHNSQGGSTAGNYTGQTLVENNIVAFNGGDGIAAYESDNVTVRHNTVAFNSTDPLNTGTWRGELSNSQGRNNHWYNNLAVCDSGASTHSNAMVEGVTDGFANTGAEWVGNLLFDFANPTRAAILVEGVGNTYAGAVALASNPLRVNPNFVQTPLAGDATTFKLAIGSPAVNAARVTYASLVDYANRTRDGLPDIGALEA